MRYASEVARRADSCFVSDGINGLEVGRRVHPRLATFWGFRSATCFNFALRHSRRDHPSHTYQHTANMVSTLVPPKVCSALENCMNLANRGNRSPLPTYVLLSPIPFSPE
jgi:hypothetical protein